MSDTPWNGQSEQPGFPQPGYPAQPGFAPQQPGYAPQFAGQGYPQGAVPGYPQGGGQPPQKPKRNFLWLYILSGVLVVVLVVVLLFVFVFNNKDGDDSSVPRVTLSASADPSQESTPTPTPEKSSSPDLPAPYESDSPSIDGGKPFPERVGQTARIGSSDSTTVASYATDDYSESYTVLSWGSALSKEYALSSLENAQTFGSWTCGQAYSLNECVAEDSDGNLIITSSSGDLNKLVAWSDEFLKLY